MSSSLRAGLGWFFVVLCLALSQTTTLHGQAFSLATNSMTVPTFADQYTSLAEVALTSDDPTFTAASLNITYNAPGGWLYTTFDSQRRVIRLTCYYGTGIDSTATVTLRTATQSATLKVNRIGISAYRTPKALLSSDKTKVYALYQDTVLLLDARTRNVLARARLGLPPGFAFSTDSGRYLTLSADEGELRVFLSDCPLLFRLSASTLSPLGSLALPPANTSGIHRVFAGERSGKLYFVRYGALLNPSDVNYSYYFQKHFESFIDVVSAGSGALLQSHSLPTTAQITTIDDLALHPERAEVWIRERRRDSSYASATWLRRLSLDADGLVQNTLGEPLFLENTSYYYSIDPWTDSTARTLLRPGAAQAISRPLVLDAAAEPPVSLPGLSSSATFLSRENVAASAGGILRLDTKESISSVVLKRADEYYSPTIVGLSDDGQDIVAMSGDSGRTVPSVHFLPAVLAAQTAYQSRVPADGQMVASADSFSWYALPGADRYRVYLSTSAADISGATPGAAFLFGEPEVASLALSSSLDSGATYFWRVDAVYGDRLVVGSVQSFAVSPARVEKQPREVATVVGARRRDFTIPIVTSTSDTSWEIISDVSWLTVRSGQGSGPGAASLSLDASALSAGDVSAALRLRTASGAVPVSLKLRVQTAELRDLVTRPGFARLLAIGPSVSINGATEQLIFNIDTSSEQILRCASVPSTALSIYTDPRPSCPTATSPLYIFGTNARIGEFDPESLELKRVVSAPNLNGQSAQIRAARPAGDCRLWLLDATNTLARLNAAGDAYDLILPTLAGERSYLSADGAALYTFKRNGKSYYESTSFTLRRYDLADDALALSAEKTVAYPSTGYYSDVPSLGLNPTRFSYLGAAYDEALKPIPALDGASLSVTEDGSSAFSGVLLHLGDTYAECRVLPPDQPYSYSRRLYEEVSRKLIVVSSSTIRFFAADSLPAVVDTSLKITSVSYAQASFGWDRAPATGGWQSYYITTQYRRARSDDDWTTPYSSYYSSLTLSYLEPKTDYEVRARVSTYYGVLSGWSETLTFTTTVAPPSYDYSTYWPSSTVLTEGSAASLSLSANGEALSWRLTGLPPGLTFNADTRTIEGSVTTPGRYEVQVVVSNAGGSFTRSLSIYVAAASAANPRARYSGLQSFAYDPLVGDWRATRSGTIITGYVRTFAGGSSFKTELPSFNNYDFYRIRNFKVRIDGVNVPATFTWDTLADRCSLTLSIYEYGSQTMSDTGRGVSYDSASPHPFAGRYTAVATEDPDNPSEYAAPDGAGFLRLDLAADGGVNVAAETALGQRFTTSTSISRDGIVPVFFPQDGYHVWGLLQLDRTLLPAQPRLAGYLGWTKYTNRKASSYRYGFEQALLVFGAPLPATGKTLPPLAPLANDDNRAELRLSGGGLNRLSKPIVQSLTPAASGLAAPKAGTPENPHRVSVKLDAKTGLVSGSAAILDPSAKKIVRTQSFRGMLVKDPLGDGRDVIGGYFHFPDGKGAFESGLLEITEPEIEPDPAALP